MHSIPIRRLVALKKTSNEDVLFGKRLRALRLKINLSAEELARGMGISPSTYRDWENGRAITGQVYHKLAE